MGGDRFYFRSYLKRRFGVGDWDDSAARLCVLVDRAPEDVVFMAHNGPEGLGGDSTDPWGCDFKPDGGDFGDPDLRTAVDYALASGRRVHAVLAGHMHHRLKGGRGVRRWQCEREGVLYINAARVPRIFTERDGRLRYHVRVTLDESGAHANAVLADATNREYDARV